MTCQHQKLSQHTDFYYFCMHICIFVHFLTQVCTLVSSATTAVQAPPSIMRESKKCLEITTPHLLNPRGAATKVPRAKTSSSQTVYANTDYSQPEKKSPSSHALKKDNNASPFFSYLNQLVWLLLLKLPITRHQFQQL